VPESIIPSADAFGSKTLGASFQMQSSHAVRLPESFRGGCSFGAGSKPVSPDVTVVKQMGGKHGPGKSVNAA
jgi:hypothetical protein